MTQALRRVAFFVFSLAITTTTALAQSAVPLQPGPGGPPKIDPADTAWMIAATALVLLMTIPGLALFYSGMVRKKNVLATMAQSLAATCVVSILWAFLAFRSPSAATARSSARCSARS